jgi:SsrA-binding protein
MALKEAPGELVVATNRKARASYTIEDTLEAGLALLGSEVKSLRAGAVQMADAFAQPRGGELYLHSLRIAPYGAAAAFPHDPVRPRKLLLHRAELDRWSAKVRERGYSIVPLVLYFKKGKAKVQLGLVRGKTHEDRREDIRERDTRRKWIAHCADVRRWPLGRGMDDRASEKKDRLLAALERGLVMVHLDARRPGVLVPPQLRCESHLRLHLSYKFVPPDLTVGEWGIRSTLSFTGQRFTVAVPWSALFAITSKVTHEFWMFPEDMPTELTQIRRRRCAPRPPRVGRWRRGPWGSARWTASASPVTPRAETRPAARHISSSSSRRRSAWAMWGPLVCTVLLGAGAVSSDLRRSPAR